MKKRGRFFSFAVLFSIIFFFQLASPYESSASNITLDPIQLYGELISGSFILNLIEVPANSLLGSEFGEISLQNFLVNDGKSIGCESFNCSGLYKVTDSGFSTANISSNSKGTVYGLLFNGVEVSSLGFSMSISSIFPELGVVPFSILVGKNYRFDYDFPSENLTDVRQFTYGCFNSEAILTEGLINSEGYCEEVSLPSSKSYFIGANISGSGLEDFVLALSKNGEDIGTCVVSLDSANYSSPIGCSIPLAEAQPIGKYDICIRAQSGLGSPDSLYSLYKESSGINCGHYSTSSSRNADYSIFAKVPLYASSNGEIDLGAVFKSSSIDSINSYISSVYGGECSLGCVVPITFYGNNVKLNISNIKSDYSSGTGPERNTLFYSLAEDSYRLNFSSIVSFKSFNWTISSYGNKSLNVYLENDEYSDELFSTKIFTRQAPFVKAVYPSNPPAGIDLLFYADVENEFTKLLWDFGDGSSLIESNKSFVKHKYSDVSNEYIISITAYDANSSIQKNYTVFTVSPENYINETLNLKRTKYNAITAEVNNFPALYRDFIKAKLQLDKLGEEITQIEISKTAALSAEDFLNVANQIGELIIPTSVVAYESKTGAVTSSYTNIDPSIVSKIVEGNYSSFEEYKTPIYSWQSNNFYSTMAQKKFRVIKDNSEKEDLITLYELDLKSKSNDTAYLIIQEPQANIYFSSGIDSLNIESNATSIEIAPNQEEVISFFVEGAKDLIMYVSPALDVLPLTLEVSVCKVDGICQKVDGENSTNCSQDCKSVLPMIFAIIGVLFFMLVIYTGLQFWYTVRYEKFLFKDRTYVFNLIAFINNSKLNAKSIGEIFSILESRGWSGEQVSYAVKKSEGKNTGMFEILPIQKIVAYLEMKKAQKIKNEKMIPPTLGEFNSRVVPGLSNFPPRQMPLRGNLGSNQFQNKRDSKRI